MQINDHSCLVLASQWISNAFGLAIFLKKVKALLSAKSNKNVVFNPIYEFKTEGNEIGSK